MRRSNRGFTLIEIMIVIAIIGIVLTISIPSYNEYVKKGRRAEVVSLLSEQPGIGARYEGARANGVRRLYLGRVGYFVYYKADAESLNVLAFWHARRGHQPSL